MKKIKILLVDDHELMRGGLQNLLEKEDDFKVVADASSGRQALLLLNEHSPQVVVMDVTMPDMSGITATIRIKSQFPEVRVLGLSMHPAGNIVGEMLKAGATGYLTKNCAAAELVKAIRLVNRGHLYLSPEISRDMVQDILDLGDQKKSNGKSGVTLSLREREVLQLVAEGKPSKAIASELFISEKTVGAHRQNIMEKLRLRSVAELTKYAIREGLTPLE